MTLKSQGDGYELGHASFTLHACAQFDLHSVWVLPYFSSIKKTFHIELHLSFSHQSEFELLIGICTHKQYLLHALLTGIESEHTERQSNKNYKSEPVHPLLQ